MKTAPLDALARSLTGPFAFCGIAVSKPGQTHFAISTAPGIQANPHTLFRVASISKIITAAVFESVAQEARLSRPYDCDVNDVLPFAVRHPGYPNDPVTLGQLMTHTSGLWDDGGYAFGGLSEAFDPRAMFGPARPGQFFRYNNLGYVLLAAAAEVIANERFDRLAKSEALQAIGLTGGFNWFGVSEAARRNTLATYRRGQHGLISQIDQHPMPPEDLKNDVLGEHTARLSPQGGLRLSLSGMLTLASTIIGGNDKPLWRQDDGPGDYCDGLFEHYGAGLQFLDAPFFYPRPLVGHFANAYGFKGGVWRDRAADISFAYALNGFPMGDESDGLSPEELQIFDAVATL